MLRRVEGRLPGGIDDGAEALVEGGVADRNDLNRNLELKVDTGRHLFHGSRYRVASAHHRSVQPRTQFTLLVSSECDHLLRLVRSLDEGEGLEHGVVEMGGHLGALLLPDALASFVGKLSGESPCPRTREDSEAHDRHGHREDDAGGCVERVGSPDERREAGNHEQRPECETNHPTAAHRKRIERVGRDAAREVAEAVALGRFAPEPDDHDPEGAQCDGGGEDIADPQPQLAEEQHGSGDHQRSSAGTAKGGRALGLGRARLRDERPQDQVREDPGPRIQAQDHESDPHQDRIDPETLPEAAGDPGHDPVAAAAEQPQAQEPPARRRPGCGTGRGLSRSGGRDHGSALDVRTAVPGSLSGTTLSSGADVGVAVGESPMVPACRTHQDRAMDENTPEEEPQMETHSQAPASAARPRLVRSRRDRKIAGVAGGIADHLNIDPVLVRIGFVVSVFAGGLGIVLYLAGWLLIPEEGDQESIGAPVVAHLRHAPWLAVLLFVLGGTLLFTQVLSWDVGTIFWALLLIGAGWLVYQDEPIGGRRDEPPPPPGAPGGGLAAAAAGTAAPAAVVEPRPRRPRSFLGRYTWGALLLLIGLAALLANAGALTLDPGQYPALALTVVGAGLLVGTFWGRSRGLILLGVLLLPIAWAGALVDVPLEGGFADRYYAPLTPALVEDEYRLVGGEMDFDLTDLEWGTEPLELEATVAFGEIEVAVPPNVEVELHGSVGGGEIQFFEDHRSGYDVEVDSVGGGDGSGGTLVIDARTSFGRIEVADSAAELADG